MGILGQTALGIDIGTHSIKVVKVARRGKKASLLGFAIEEIEFPEDYNPARSETIASGVEAGTEMEGRENALAAALSRSMSSLSHKGCHIRGALSGPGVLIKQIPFPDLGDRQIEAALKYEARKFVPWSVEEMVVDFQVLSEDHQAGTCELLLVAARVQQKETLLRLLETGCNISPVVLDVEPLAIVNALFASKREPVEGLQLIVDVGHSYTTLCFYKPGAPFFSRHLSNSGMDFSAQIMRQAGVDYLRAEEMKKGKTDVAVSLDVYRPVFNDLLQEIRRSLIYYGNQTAVSADKTKVHVCGGGARLVPMVDYFREGLDLSVEILDPLSGLQSSASDETDGIGPQMAMAVGLAWR